MNLSAFASALSRTRLSSGPATAGLFALSSGQRIRRVGVDWAGPTAPAGLRSERGEELVEGVRVSDRNGGSGRQIG
jgi:hypothetical protein